MVLHRYLTLFLAAAAFVGLSASTATAQQTLLAINSTQLLKIDPATATATVLGNLTAVGLPSGIDWRGGKLYLLMEGSNPANIYEIDPNTGATLVGPTAITGPGPFAEGDVAFRSDGIGFTSSLGNGLWSFDLSKPLPSMTLLTNNPPGLDGLAFDAADVLWGLQEGGVQLFQINQVTGVATAVGAPTGFNGGGLSTGGLAIDSTGKFYGIADIAFKQKLFSIDPVTGLGTFIGDVTPNPISRIRGIRFTPGGPPPPPPPPPPPGGGGGGGGIGEGNYPGSSGMGADGGEGGFGFGRSASSGRFPRFSQPSLHGPGRQMVFNVSHRQASGPQIEAGQPSRGDVLSLLAPMLIAMGVTGSLYGVFKYVRAWRKP